jgi:uncharacterized protein (TIGR02217 family)
VSFKNIRAPTGWKYSAVGGPVWLTDIARLPGGRRQANKRRDNPLRRFRVDRALKTDAFRTEFLNFMYVLEGAANTFRLKDFTDFEVSVDEGVFRSLNNGTFQLVKRYSVRSVSETSPQVLYTKDIDILLPVEDTITITGLTEGTHWRCDYSTPSGIVTSIGSPTPTFSTWSGQYDVHCSFDTDEIMLIAEDIDLFFANSITITEERAP